MKSLAFKNFIYLSVILVFSSFVSCKKEINFTRPGVWTVDNFKVTYSQSDTDHIDPYGRRYYTNVGTSATAPFDYFYFDFKKEGEAKLYTKFLSDSVFHGLDFFSKLKTNVNFDKGNDIVSSFDYMINSRTITLAGLESKVTHFMKGKDKKIGFDDAIDLVYVYYSEDSLKLEITEFQLKRVRKNVLPN